MADFPSFPDHEFRPDPSKVTRHHGAYYHPVLNLTVLAALTVGSAGAAIYMAVRRAEMAALPWYPDQDLDLAGLLFGIIVSGLVAAIMLGLVIYTALWWKRKIALRSGLDRPR